MSEADDNSGNGDGVKILLDRGADTSLKNTGGRTARSLASCEEVIAQLPEDAGAMTFQWLLRGYADVASDGGDIPEIDDDAEGDLVLEEGSEEDDDDDDDGDVEYDVEDDLN